MPLAVALEEPIDLALEFAQPSFEPFKLPNMRNSLMTVISRRIDPWRGLIAQSSLVRAHCGFERIVASAAYGHARTRGPEQCSQILTADLPEQRCIGRS